MLWQFSRKRSLLLLLLLVLSSVTQGLGLVLLVPMLDVFQGLETNSGSVVGIIVDSMRAIGFEPTLQALLLAFLALNIARALVIYSQAIVSENLRLELLDDLRSTSFDAVLEARWAWHVTQKKSDISNLLLNEIGRLGSALMFSLQLLTTIFSIIVYSVVAFALSFWLTATAIGLGLVLFVSLSRQHKLAQLHGQALTEANQQVQQTVEEGLAGIKLIKILRREAHQSVLMRAIRGRLRERTIAFARLNAGMTLIFQSLAALAMVAVLYLGTASLGLPLSTLLVLIVLFARLAPLIRDLQRQINGMRHADAALTNRRETLRQALEASESTIGQQVGVTNQATVSFQHEITLTDVYYAYRDREAPSLAGVSIAIPHGKTTAIMGPSGSGKSTLADLVMGLLRPDDGLIRIDGIALDDSNRLSWRQSVAYMPQDVFFFHDTIRNNLGWANEDADESELRTALERAAATFVFDLPQGIDTVVGDLGHRLSGGERQRIALARAILQQPQLMILDEATSALDYENEAKICRTLKELNGDLTVVMLGHRKSTLDFADQLILVEDGRVSHAI